MDEMKKGIYSQILMTCLVKKLGGKAVITREEVIEVIKTQNADTLVSEIDGTNFILEIKKIDKNEDMIKEIAKNIVNRMF